MNSRRFAFSMVLVVVLPAIFVGARLMTGPTREGALPEPLATPDGLDSEDEPEARLLRRERVLDQHLLGFPLHLAVFDTAIAILDTSSLDGQLLLLDRETGGLIASAGPVGQGPGDLNRPNSLQPVYGDRPGVWVNDYRNSRLVLYGLDSLTEGPTRTIKKPGAWATEIALLGNHLFVSGAFDSELLQAFELVDDETLAPTGVIGEPLFPDQPPALRGELNASTLAVEPNGERFAVAFGRVARLHIMDASGNLIQAIEGPQEVAVDLPRDPNDDPYPNAQVAYNHVAATATHIIGLFSGSENPYGNQLHVFTWDGDLVGRWLVEEELAFIAVDPLGQRLYGVRHHPEPAIVEYELIPWQRP
jgi:hypothetical protein